MCLIYRFIQTFFDFVEQTALVDVPVLLAASGGSDRHATGSRTSVTPIFSGPKHRRYRSASYAPIEILP